MKLQGMLSWDRTAPMPSLLASVVSANGLEKSGYLIIGAEHSFCLRDLNVVS